MDSTTINQGILTFVQQFPYVWTFFLLLTRFSVLFGVIPGLGMGARGMAVRFPAAMALTLAVMKNSPIVPLPPDIPMMIFGILSEACLGGIIGILPTMIIGGAQMAGMLSSTAMGLNAGNLIDPHLGSSTSDISRIYSDLVILMFLFIGGHYTCISVASTTSGILAPGTLLYNPFSADLIARLSADIFEVGIMLAAPVIVALMLTNFVMGLISKAVPTINLFIISFPLTVGIGLILTGLSLPDAMFYLERKIVGIDQILVQWMGT